MTQTSRRPKAIKLDDAPEADMTHQHVQPETVDALTIVPDELAPTPDSTRKKPRRLFKLLLGAIAAFTTLVLGLAAEEFISNLFAQNTTLAFIASALLGFIALILLIMIVREFWGLFRLRKLEKIQNLADQAHQFDQLDKAKAVQAELNRLYANRADIQIRRQNLSQKASHIFDGRDLIELMETELMTPLDRQAHQLIAQSARRVSVVTAVSPRALFDMIYVTYESVKLVRQLAQLYGGRPGGLALWRLSGTVFSQLAITGGVGMSDGLVQQLTGQGIAAKLSKKLGEGVINGLLTARIGIAAIRNLRPLPFNAQKQPQVTDFMAELVKWHKLGESAETPEKTNKL